MAKKKEVKPTVTKEKSPVAKQVDQPKNKSRFVPHFFCKGVNYNTDYEAAIAQSEDGEGLEARVVKETPIDAKQWGTESIAVATFTAATAKSILSDPENFFDKHIE